MKKYLFVFITILQLTHSLEVHAGAAGGGATEFTQIFNNVELGLIAGTDLTTSISTTLDMTKSTILDPIANALITSALNSASNDIMAWVNGGFSGGAPLIIANPQRFIQGKGLDVVKGALGNIPTNSAFGDSIFNTVLSGYKGTNDLPAQIKSLSQSKIPGIVQNSMCEDSQLTALAKESVNNPNNIQEVTTRKKELYTYACQGNPNDPEVAARLNDLSAQNPNLGGWDKWLYVTGGGNAYTNAAKTQVIVDKQVAAEQELIKNEIFNGAGPISQKECVKYAEVTDPYEKPQCLEEQTITPGKTVNALLSKASSAGLDRLSTIMGAGSITGMLSNLAMSAITNGINKAIGGGSGGARAVNTSTTLTASRPIIQDLANDPARKRELVSTMEKQFSYYVASLDKLEATDRAYLADLYAYEARIQPGKTCYDNLVQSNIVTTSNPGFVFFAGRQNTINTTRNSLNQELSKISQARQLIAVTSSRLSASNSSTEIGTIFNDYSTTVDNQKLPDIQAQPTRNGEYTLNKSNISRDTDVTNYQNACTQLQQQQTQYYQP